MKNHNFISFRILLLISYIFLSSSLYSEDGISNLERFKTIDQHALDAPDSVEKDIDLLAAYLIEPAQSDIEKTRAIYRWITAHIDYDIKAYMARKNSFSMPQDVLRAKKSVCSGYANLFKALCDSAGVTALIVNGYARSTQNPKPTQYTGAINHAWNLVQLDEKWYLIDSTWGAGYVNKGRYTMKYNDFYFLTPPDQFIFSHYPAQPDWQLLETPVTPEQFSTLPNLHSQYFKIGFDVELLLKYVHSEGFNGVPRVYIPPISTKIISCPMEYSLSSKETYGFHISMPEAASVAVINGKDWHYLTEKNGIWSGRFKLKKGSVMVGYSLNGKQSRHTGMLSYKVK